MTIVEVSEKFNVSQDTLLYYERVRLIPNVNRNERGIKDYTEVDCNWVEFIKCMHGAGISIEVLIEYVELFLQGDETLEARRELFNEQRQLLRKRAEDMKRILERIDHKVTIFDRKQLTD